MSARKKSSAPSARSSTTPPASGVRAKQAATDDVRAIARIKEMRAAATEARARIADAVKVYDANSSFTMADVKAYLRDIEESVIKAVGLLGIAINDECGPDRDDLRKATCVLTNARGALQAAESNLQRCGVFGDGDDAAEKAAAS